MRFRHRLHRLRRARIGAAGPAKAATIVEDREANGPFTSCEDLTRVPGIGRTTVSNLIDQCAVDDSGRGVGL